MEKPVFCIYDLRMIKAALQGQLDKDSFTRAALQGQFYRGSNHFIAKGAL